MSAAYLYEKTAKGNIHLRWYAKKIDGTTPLYNDTAMYRTEYSYYHNITNIRSSELYNNQDGIPIRNLSLIVKPNRYGYQEKLLTLNEFLTLPQQSQHVSYP